MINIHPQAGSQWQAQVIARTPLVLGLHNFSQQGQLCIDTIGAKISTVVTFDI